ncbi:Uncharacterised protein [Candidatus Norongarragalina meridionalis]|nr:Uncharacterised protein [Candidatus Norongarragalina meridionalis]
MFVLSSSMLSDMQRDAQGSSMRTSLAAISSAAADSLLRSPGTPVDWTNASVESLGLADEPFVLNLTKLIRLRDVQSQDVSWLAGVGRLNASLNITRNGTTLRSGILREPIAYFSTGDVDIPPYLQGMAWDYYWNGAVPPEWLDSRQHYDGASFDEVLENRDAYYSIIVEDAALSNDAVNISALQDFVSDGGLLLCEGRCAGLLGDNFSVSYQTYGVDRIGVLAENGFLIYGASTGAPVLFASAREGFYSNESRGEAPMRVHVSDSVNASVALIGAWEYGNGVIYYVADADASFGGVPASQSLNLRGFPLAFGNQPSGDANVFVTRRPCLIEGDFRQPALFEILVWGSNA